jgi:hypothetical protein
MISPMLEVRPQPPVTLHVDANGADQDAHVAEDGVVHL